MTPKEIFERMMENDQFSRWLNVQLIDISLGACSLQMTVTPQMLNGFSIAHGGLSYALSDSALAFASNSYGFHCVSIETNISHFRPVFEKDVLRAVCTEVNRSKTLGVYEVAIHNQNNKLISHFKGTVKVLEKEWNK